MFLGVGIGCALPLVVGTGLGSAGILPIGKNDGTGDEVWDHIASEGWKTWREMQGPLGVRGEHVRRLAAQIDLFAVHLRGGGHDRRLDEEVRRLISEHGRESAAAEIVRRCHDDPILASRNLTRGRGSAPDAATMAKCLDELAARGSTHSLRSRRASLEHLAVILDRSAATTAGRVVPAVGQKPGDDFGGYPAPTVGPGLCDQLEFMIVAFDLLTVLLPLLGVGPAGVASGVMGAACELVWFLFCRERAT